MHLQEQLNDKLKTLQNQLSNLLDLHSDSIYADIQHINAEIALTKAQLDIIHRGGTAPTTAVINVKTHTIYDVSFASTKYGYKSVINIPNQKPIFVANLSSKSLKKYNFKKIIVNRPIWARLDDNNSVEYYQVKNNRAKESLTI